MEGLENFMSPISLNPSTFVEGGLPGDDTDSEIVDCRFMLFDYGGKSDGGPALCLGVQLQPLNAQGQMEGKAFEQYYSAGDKKYFTPNATNDELVPITEDHKALNRNTNVAQLFAALIQAGLPVSILEAGKSTGLVGLRAHWNRVAQPKRSGLVNAKSDGREATILLPSRIISLPTGRSMVQPIGQVAQAAQAAQAPTLLTPFIQAPSTAAASMNVTAPLGDPAVDALAAETLIGILAMSGGAIKKVDLATAAFRASNLEGNALKPKVVARMFQDAFLSSMNGVRFDGVTVSLG